jgi:glycosyltransferase involved in cell wall biosynthesis
MTETSLTNILDIFSQLIICNPIYCVIEANTCEKSKLLYNMLQYVQKHNLANNIFCFDINQNTIHNPKCKNAIIIHIIKELIDTRYNLNKLTILEYDPAFDFDIGLLSSDNITITTAPIIHYFDHRIMGITLDSTIFKNLANSLVNNMRSGIEKNIYDIVATIQKPIRLTSPRTKFSFNAIYDNISECSHYQIATINSIHKKMSDLFYINHSLDNLLHQYGSDTPNTHQFLKNIITCYRDIHCCRSLVSGHQLVAIRNILKQRKISIRNIMYLDHGLSKYVNKKDLLDTLKKYDLDKFYANLDDQRSVDVINEIFYPIEDLEHACCIIIPSYCNITTYRQTLDSIYDQTYQHYRILYIDDRSDNNEIDEIKKYIDQCDQNYRTIVVLQETRQRQCAGRYIGYHMAYDDEIVLFVDGDDRMARAREALSVMHIISALYHEQEIVATYGGHDEIQHDNVLSGTVIKGNEQFPIQVIKKKNYRHYKIITGHLRTGYAKLFKSIDLLDLLDWNDKFYHIMTDYAETMPVLEMATPDIQANIMQNHPHKNFSPINRVLYHYNVNNSIKYPTAYSRRNEHDNYYKQYRIDAHKKIRSCNRYPYLLKKNNNHDNVKIIILSNGYPVVIKLISLKYFISDYLMSNNNKATNTSEHKYAIIQNNQYVDMNKEINKEINIDGMIDVMENYGLDALVDTKYIVNGNGSASNIFDEPKLSDKFLFLTGKIINHNPVSVASSKLKVILSKHIDMKTIINKYNYIVIRTLGSRNRNINHGIDGYELDHIVTIGLLF